MLDYINKECLDNKNRVEVVKWQTIFLAMEF